MQAKKSRTIGSTVFAEMGLLKAQGFKRKTLT